MAPLKAEQGDWGSKAFSVIFRLRRCGILIVFPMVSLWDMAEYCISPYTLGGFTINTDVSVIRPNSNWLVLYKLGSFFGFCLFNKTHWHRLSNQFLQVCRGLTYLWFPRRLTVLLRKLSESLTFLHRFALHLFFEVSLLCLPLAYLTATL